MPEATEIRQGGRLKSLRIRLSMTQGQVAQAAGFPSYRTVLLAEKGRNKLTLAKAMRKFGVAFRLTTDEMTDVIEGKLSIAMAEALFHERAPDAAEAARESARPRRRRAA